jgi:4-hydroxy-tetrahydrodipicolinate reductase
MSAISLAITGAAGRMGRRLLALACEQPDIFKVVGALDAAPAFANQDAGALAGIAPLGVLISPTLPNQDVDVLIDFSAPAATRAFIPQCIERDIALLIGTTGLVPSDHTLIDEAAKSIPILQAANTSLGVNLLLAISAQIAQRLGPDYDIEIVEAHHNQKKDAPSGTALALADSICKATSRDVHKDLVHGRVGHDAKRVKGTIGMHAIRMGDVVGDHTIFYAAQGERVELRHVASTRDTFAKGALRAAQFLSDQNAGRYTMADVLGL